MNHLKGEALKADFDGSIKLEFHGAKVTINKELFTEILLRIKKILCRTVKFDIF